MTDYISNENKIILEAYINEMNGYDAKKSTVDGLLGNLTEDRIVDNFINIYGGYGNEKEIRVLNKILVENIPLIRDDLRDPEYAQRLKSVISKCDEIAKKNFKGAIIPIKEQLFLDYPNIAENIFKENKDNDQNKDKTNSEDKQVSDSQALKDDVKNKIPKNVKIWLRGMRYEDTRKESFNSFIENYISLDDSVLINEINKYIASVIQHFDDKDFENKDYIQTLQTIIRECDRHVKTEDIKDVTPIKDLISQNSPDNYSKIFPDNKDIDNKDKTQEVTDTLSDEENKSALELTSGVLEDTLALKERLVSIFREIQKIGNSNKQGNKTDNQSNQMQNGNANASQNQHNHSNNGGFLNNVGNGIGNGIGKTLKVADNLTGNIGSGLINGISNGNSNASQNQNNQNKNNQNQDNQSDNDGILSNIGSGIGNGIGKTLKFADDVTGNLGSGLIKGIGKALS